MSPKPDGHPGAELRASRVARFLSLQEVAEAAGLLLERLADIELGRGKPPTSEEQEAIQTAIDSWAARIEEEDD